MSVANNMVASKPKDNVTVFTTDTGEIKLSNATVKSYLVNGNGSITDQEAMMFIALCKGQKLNPFIKEAYLIKYSDTQPASMVVAKDVFQKRADRNPDYDGKKAGVIVENNESGEVIYRDGAFYKKSVEKVIGGWCEVFKKNRSHSERIEVSFDEYAATKKDGSLNSNWTNRPATMIRKVAVVQALREAFTSDFQGMYVAEELGINEDELPKETVDQVIEVQAEPVQEYEPDLL